MNIMNAPTLTSDTLSILLLSLQRICYNLSHMLDTLDADVNSVRRILTDLVSSISESSSLSNFEEVNYYELEKNEDFYEQLFDEQLEPKPPRVTML